MGNDKVYLRLFLNKSCIITLACVGVVWTFIIFFNFIFPFSQTKSRFDHLNGNIKCAIFLVSPFQCARAKPER